jgi:hypothetical protein
MLQVVVAVVGTLAAKLEVLISLVQAAQVTTRVAVVLVMVAKV